MQKENKQKILCWNDLDTQNRLIECLQAQKIFIGTTDTVLGLFSLVNEAGFLVLNKLKGREKKPYIILISDKNFVTEYAEFSCNQAYVERLMESCWPGPLSIICKAKKSTPDFMKSENGTIAFRMPNHKEILSLIKHVGPLFSTSANKAGEPVPEAIEQIDRLVLAEIEYVVVDNIKSEKNNSVPSTIIDLSGSEPRIVRQGACEVSILENNDN